MRFLPILLCVLFVGCGTSGNAKLQDHILVDQIIVGQTTKEEVKTLLGEPQMLSVTASELLASHEVWVYSYASYQTNPVAYVPVVGLFAMAGGATVADMKSRSLTIQFSEGGTVTSISRQDFGNPTEAPPNTVHSDEWE